MLIHADLQIAAIVDAQSLPWVEAPMAGVSRRMLERDGGERARATSLVRYDAGSHFEAHTHDAGEEFLVLDGVFSDESGDFGAGMYVRNPPGSRHRPFSREGATILVKLRQFAADDLSAPRIDTRDQSLWQPGPAQGSQVLPLHRHGSEQVCMLRLDAGAELALSGDGFAEGLAQELFVVEGALEDGGQGTWIRRPPGQARGLRSPQGCLVFMKVGHLSDQRAPTPG